MIDQEVQSLLEKGTITKVNPESPSFYSRIFLVPKKDGGQHPVINLCPLNQFVDKKSFKMDTLKSLKEILRPGDWAVTLDIKDAYFHIPIHMKSRKFSRFLWRKKAFQFVVLPFGLTSAPRVFYSSVQGFNSVLSKERYQGDCVSRRYPCSGKIIQGMSAKQRSGLKTFKTAGGSAKSQEAIPIPSQVFTYLGLLWNTKVMRVSLQDLRQTAQLILSKTQLNCHQAMEVPKEGKSCS